MKYYIFCCGTHVYLVLDRVYTHVSVLHIVITTRGLEHTQQNTRIIAEVHKNVFCGILFV